MIATRTFARAGLASALVAGAITIAACRARAVAPGGSASPVRSLHVVMINGGGTKAGNYQSHLLHVRQLLDLLGQTGVEHERITIFSGDGADPEADLAVREKQPERDFWLVEYTKLAQQLRTPITYANSEVPGFELHPATRSAIDAWFKTARRQLHAGDTLLLYVTDHGGKNEKDTTDNTITLWGKQQSLSVTELRTLLAGLEPGVRVVALMSQCFSGAFAHLVTAHLRDGAPGGNVCGYFSSTADRPAYGCYPENLGKENVGHSFDFFQALGATGRFPAAHERVLVTDRTPDVPIRSSDVYLEGLLERAAKAAGTPPAAFTDELLREAWRDRAAWEPDIRLLDRIAQSFGMFSPRTLAELEEQAKRLPDIHTQLGTHAGAWQAARGDLAGANIGHFLEDHPTWETTLATLKPTDREPATRFLTQLGEETRGDVALTDRLELLRGRSEVVGAAAYRMEVRLGAVLRMRAVLSSIAGRVFLATRATPAERAAFEVLRACESLPLPVPGAADVILPPPPPYPSFEDDVALARQMLPSWMGISFRQANAKRREAQNLPKGAASVLAVYPDSPAKAAGLAPGDIVLGPPGEHFTQPNQIREWIMLSKLDVPVRLDVLRESKPLRVTLVPKPFPLTWPELPGPPKVGSAAPPVVLTAYRGTPPKRLDRGAPHLLFFWATWCAPCKASLPEVLAFAEARRTAVVAITDEPSEELDKFFARFTSPFPPTVAIDEDRRTSFAFGVTGTPTFVLVDGSGTVRASGTGYRPDQGLPVEGWTWVGRSPALGP